MVSMILYLHFIHEESERVTLWSMVCEVLSGKDTLFLATICAITSFFQMAIACLTDISTRVIRGFLRDKITG